MKAKVISIAQAKGGVGKSTLCANLAVTFSQSSKVLMIDCDPPQNSLSQWFKVREDLYEETGLHCLQASTPAQFFQLLDKHGKAFDYIFVDGAPHINPMARAMLLASNLVLVPLAPSSVEIWSFDTFEQLLLQAQKLNSHLTPKIVWNRVRKRVKSADEVIHSVNKESKLTAFKNQLTFRVAYMDSFAQGCSVYEWSDPVASAEIWSLSSAVKRALAKAKPFTVSKSKAAQDFVKKGH